MPHSSPPSRPATRAALERHAGAVTVLMNMMLVRHLISVYKAFDGDVVAAIVLGEIAHYNLSPLIGRTRTAMELSRVLQSGRDSWQEALLPTNTYSIAQATGIPRETVRRKVADLVRRGWIVRDAAGNLFVAADANAAFADFHVDRLRDLLAASRAIETLLQDDSGAAVHRRRRANSSKRSDPAGS